MQLQIRRNKEIGVMVHDEIIFQNNHSEAIVVGKGGRGSYDEKPYTPITRYWSYKASLYQAENRLIIQITNITKIVDTVDGNWQGYETQNLISTDGGASWSETTVVEVESLLPISFVVSSP